MYIPCVKNFEKSSKLSNCECLKGLHTCTYLGLVFFHYERPILRYKIVINSLAGYLEEGIREAQVSWWGHSHTPGGRCRCSIQQESQILRNLANFPNNKCLKGLHICMFFCYKSPVSITRLLSILLHLTFKRASQKLQSHGGSILILQGIDADVTAN